MKCMNMHDIHYDVAGHMVILYSLEDIFSWCIPSLVAKK